jgi:hypothetical protein
LGDVISSIPYTVRWVEPVSAFAGTYGQYNLDAKLNPDYAGLNDMQNWNTES